MEDAVRSTVASLVQALNDGDVDAALRHYDAGAVFVAQPGKMVRGTAAIGDALRAMVAARPRLTTHRSEVLAAGELALYLAHWSMELEAADGRQTASACSADVLRRGPDGAWRVLIDDPWGTALVGAPMPK